MFLPSQSVGRRFSPSADGDNREREKSGCIFSGMMAEVLGLKGTLRMNPARGETSYFCLLFSAFHYVAFWFAKHGISLGRRVFSPSVPFLLPSNIPH